MNIQRKSVTMLIDQRGSENGHDLKMFLRGETYTMERRLAEAFIAEKWAVEAKEEKAVPEAPENKMLAAAPENKAATPKRKVVSKGFGHWMLEDGTPVEGKHTKIEMLRLGYEV